MTRAMNDLLNAVLHRYWMKLPQKLYETQEVVRRYAGAREDEVEVGGAEGFADTSPRTWR